MGLFDKFKKEAGKKDGKSKTTPVKSVRSKSKETKTAEVEKKESMKDLYSGIEAGSAKPIAGKAKKDKKFGNAYQVLVRPVVTEKAAHFGTENKYVFAVAPGANKISIAKAIDEVYGIKPVSINIINVRGKKVKYGRISGQRKGWKKAMVSLPAGKTINIYEGV
ncbi:MAG: 50S ribosomal protein L23 [Candidatus Falkowbacteria bacterium]|nr:50S ribosomal protein L23 [Candidatus Falkowbacteria bacterium]